MSDKLPAHSLYIHIPFCAHRCAYCDFNTYAGQEQAIPAYVKALCNEIQAVGQSAAGRLGIGTIFFGGGTPSLLNPAHYQDLFQNIYRYFDVWPAAEISLEANPGTVSRASLQALREVGFNRISFGAQSANAQELRMLERAHSFYDVIDSVNWSRQAGFDNLSLDLIYGLPEQTLTSWQHTVKWALSLRPTHLSAYALTLEHGTPFGRWAAKGLLPLPDPDLAAEMYTWLEGHLTDNAYAQYEISNWALASDPRKNFQCRHNLQYWRNLPYLGLGAGAHGYANSLRYANVLRIKTYIERLRPPLPPLNFPRSPAVVQAHHNTLREEMDETMLTGLRLTVEGISEQTFSERFGLGLDEVYGEKIEKLTQLGLLERADDRLRLTPRGRLLGNQVFLHFVGD